MEYVSEAVWAVIILAAIVWEIIGVRKEKEWGVEPLTRIVRDRLMRRFWPVKLLVVGFLVWLLLHWALPLDW